jgi:putative ABC transport system permease protein
MARVRTALADLGAVSIRSNGEIRRASLEIFDRTFAITRVLRLLALGVAFIGILSALMALQLERAREYAILRATGFTPGQVVGIVGLQTLFMGACAATLAMPLGLVMSQLLIHVINRRAFGWSMTMEIPEAVLLEAVVLALVAALLGGLYPAWRLSRTPPARALREE